VRKLFEIPVKTRSRNEVIDVTEKVQAIVSKENIESGACIVFCPHTTAAVIVNENHDTSLADDILANLSEIAPKNAKYSHLEGNADAHIKTALVGGTVLIPIENKKIALGRWQGCLFLEFDGPRQRRLLVQFII